MTLKPKNYFNVLIEHYIKLTIHLSKMDIPVNENPITEYIWNACFAHIHTNRYSDGKTYSEQEEELMNVFYKTFLKHVDLIGQKLNQEAAGLPITLAHTKEELVYLEMIPEAIDEIYKIYLDYEN